MTDDGEPPKEDSAKLVDLLVEGCTPATVAALKLLAAPHWVPAGAVFAHLREDVLPELPALIDATLVRVSPSGSLYVSDQIRQGLRVRSTEQEVVANAARMAAIFRLGNDPESEIEALYHELFVDPLEASRKMFRAAQNWRQVPYFAHHLVQRLLRAWHEAHEQRPLAPPAYACLRFLELVTTSRPPLQELGEIETFDTSGDRLFAALILLRKSILLTSLNRIQEAQACLARAYVEFEELDHPIGMAQAHLLLGRTAFKRDAYATAARLYRHALDLARVAERRHIAGIALQGMADIATFTGAFGEASERYEEAIAELVAVGARSAEGNARNGYSQVLNATGKIDLAREHVRQAEAIFKSLEQRQGQANSQRAAAQIELEAGELDAATAHLRQALQTYREYGTSTGEAASIELLGQVHQLRRELDEAEACYREACERFMEIEDQFGAASCRRDLGALALERGMQDRAIEYLRQSAREFRRIGADVECAAATLLLWLADEEVDAARAAQTLAAVGTVVPRVYRRVWEASPKTVGRVIGWTSPPGPPP